MTIDLMLVSAELVQKYKDKPIPKLHLFHESSLDYDSVPLLLFDVKYSEAVMTMECIMKLYHRYDMKDVDNCRKGE